MDLTQHESLKKTMLASKNKMNKLRVFYIQTRCYKINMFPYPNMEMGNKYVLRVKFLANTAFKSHRLNVYQ
jgi:hypothetical protein